MTPTLYILTLAVYAITAAVAVGASLALVMEAMR